MVIFLSVHHYINKGYRGAFLKGVALNNLDIRKMKGKF